MIYENMLSGAFIYALGLVSGKKADGQPSADSINFINQTPYDKSIADLFAELQGKFFIVEFKRSLEAVKTEFEKPHKAKMLKDIQKDEEMLKLSLRCHYLAYGDQNGTNIQINFREYIPDKGVHPVRASDFIEGALDPEFPIGIKNKQNIAKYMSFLMRYGNKGDVDAIVICSSSGGKPMFFKIENYVQMRQEIRPTVENNVTHNQNLKPPGHDRSQGYNL